MHNISSDHSIYSKKQISFSNFNARIFASILDALISSLILLPVSIVLTLLIYGSNSPANVLQPVMQDLLEKKVPALSIIGEFLSDPRVSDYFLNQGGLFKYALDSALQVTLVTLMVVCCWFWRQATPGKMLLSLKIVDAETFQTPTRKQFIIRSLGYFVSALPFFLGFVWMLFNKKRQTWHDLMAGTVVIKN